MKMTPAEQHIAEQSERRDLTSICRRLARVEDRLATISSTAGQAHKGMAELCEHVESIKESLEGAHAGIEKLMLRVDAKMLRDVGIPEDVIERLVREVPGEIKPFPGPARPFDFGAELRRTVDEADRDMAAICGQEPQAVLNRVPAYIRRAEEERPAQDAYNRRMSEILARVAADIERANAYYALVDRLHRGVGVQQTGRQAGAELHALWKALGSPLRPGEQPPEGHDHAEG